MSSINNGVKGGTREKVIWKGDVRRELDDRKGPALMRLCIFPCFRRINVGTKGQEDQGLFTLTHKIFEDLSKDCNFCLV